MNGPTMSGATRRGRQRYGADVKTKRQIKVPRKKQLTFELVANGLAGSWEISVDETTDGPQRWYLQIDGPMCYLNFRIADPIVVRASLDFLRGHLCPGQCQEKSVTRRSVSNELE